MTQLKMPFTLHRFFLSSKPCQYPCLEKMLVELLLFSIDVAILS